MANEEFDPRDFSLYGSGFDVRRAFADSLLRDSEPCQPYITKQGKKVKTPARVLLTSFELDLMQRALSGYQRELMHKPRKTSLVEDSLECLMERLKMMEGEP